MSLNRRQVIQAGAGALAGFAVARCGGESGPVATSDTVVFRNGIVLPVDAAFSEYQALAIQGNKILAVGNEDSVMSAAGRGARTIDLEGRTMLPGFIEPHMHFLLMAGLGHLEDVGPFKYPTFQEALDALARINKELEGQSADAWVAAR